MTELTIPQLSLVLLVGATGSGKSTFSRSHFLATEVLSSDACRAMVCDDETNQAATKDAFDVLHHIAGKRLAAGRLTVVDATNVQPQARKPLIALAREHDVLPVAIVLDLPPSVCAQRNAGRPDRQFGPHVLQRQVKGLRRSVRGLQKEGLRTVHVLSSEEEVAQATITRTRLYNDLRDRSGPFDAIGDVHGCRDELERLLVELGYTLRHDDRGRAVGARHPGGRTAVFLGDLVDRGPDTPGVLRLVMGMVRDGDALCVPGNHENKLSRALAGRKVQISHGLAESLEQLAAEPEEFTTEVRAFLDDLVSHYVLDGGRLVVCHAGLPQRYHGRASGRVREFCLYGQTTGETDEYGLPIRYPWAEEYRGSAMVLYGHTPVPEAEWVNNTMCVDTGAVFGGRLSALRYPERELVSVPASRVHYEPAKPFPVAGEAAPPATARPTGDLAVTDVLPVDSLSRIVETAHAGRVTIRRENAAAALEVVSRFAIDPRWLVYLPPTMAPVSTAPATGPSGDLLEHPVQAFEAFRAEGVGQVICQEKHMGSRATALVCRDPAAAHRRFGTDGQESGAVWTRTGRSFFGPGRSAELVGRLARAVEVSGVFDELGSDWVLLDGEILPWNAKAEDLLRDQYAAVGAAAAAALPAAAAALDQAANAGLDVADLLASTVRRAANAEAFRDSYRRYVRPTDGLSGVAFAPFQVLAAEGATGHDRPHRWHLGVADRLVAADPDLVAPTARIVVDTADPASTAAGVAWWDGLTGAGGEGMVVKPAVNLVRGARGLAQPGLKVRGREYLRIIYGPDYLDPGNLERLRERNVARKRGLAAREYALGVEAIDRLVRGEPLWRVHECVVGVLALESEPVDPRL